MIGKSLPKAVGTATTLPRARVCCWLHAWRECVFQCGAWDMPRDGASAGGGVHIPHGLANAMLLPTVMEFNGWFVVNALVRLVGRCELKNPRS